MSLKIYNTLTGKKETLETLEPNRIKMYVCGMTVYDHTHIGHARTFLCFDLIVLIQSKFAIEFVLLVFPERCWSVWLSATACNYVHNWQECSYVHNWQECRYVHNWQECSNWQVYVQVSLRVSSHPSRTRSRWPHTSRWLLASFGRWQLHAGFSQSVFCLLSCCLHV